eukprot:jgi/Undpi1/2827/HiC_scaffold_14.g06204.m1
MKIFYFVNLLEQRRICAHLWTGHPRTPAAPALGLAANGAKASVTLRDITQSIDDVVQSERRKRCGDTISEDETRDLVVRALVEHKSFRAYRQEHVLTDPSSPSPYESRIVAAMRDMNESLSKPAIVASTPGSEARRVLVAAAVGKGVSFTGLKNAIGPVQREFVAECSKRRKRAMSTTSGAELVRTKQRRFLDFPRHPESRQDAPGNPDNPQEREVKWEAFVQVDDNGKEIRPSQRGEQLSTARRQWTNGSGDEWEPQGTSIESTSRKERSNGILEKKAVIMQTA